VRPAIEVGWGVQFTFEKRSNGGRPTQEDVAYSNVDRFEMLPNNVPADWEVGNTYLVQVNKISGDYARVQPYHPQRKDSLRPGYSVEVTITDYATSGVALGAIESWPHIDEVKLYGGAPATPDSVRISAIAPLEGFAVADVNHFTWPAAGSEITVEATQGQSRVMSAAHGYEFPIERQAPISGRARVRVQYRDDQLVGELLSYEEGQPQVGDVVDAELDFQRQPGVAWLPSSGDRVELMESYAVGGDATIRITDASHPLRGELVSLPDSIPEVGAVVEAYARRTDHGEAIARPGDFTGVIQLPDGVEGTGFVRVRITERESVLCGEVVEYLGAPEEGDVLVASVERGNPPNTAVSVVGERDIHLDERVLATGRVEVRVVDAGPPLRGEIVSYGGLLPEEGDEVMAKVSEKGSTAIAEPVHGTCKILVSDAAGYSGLASVEVTDVGKFVRGSMVEELDVEQKRRRASSESPFKHGGDHPNLVQKKH